jgi:hypothetical protein
VRVPELVAELEDVEEEVEVGFGQLREQGHQRGEVLLAAHLRFLFGLLSPQALKRVCTLGRYVSACACACAVMGARALP